jgi:hypothetical protein
MFDPQHHSRKAKGRKGRRKEGVSEKEKEKGALLADASSPTSLKLCDNKRDGPPMH